MRLVSVLLACAACAMTQQPIGIGPDNSAGISPGLSQFFSWYLATPTGGCVPGSTPPGACVGHSPQGDTYYWSAWMPNASGLPVTSGLPIVGTANDFSLTCSGNLELLQLDTWSWLAPTASHI